MRRPIVMLLPMQMDKIKYMHAPKGEKKQAYIGEEVVSLLIQWPVYMHLNANVMANGTFSNRLARLVFSFDKHAFEKTRILFPSWTIFICACV